jgi:hypothetical protein
MQSGRCYSHAELCAMGKIEPVECADAKANPNNELYQYSMMFSCTGQNTVTGAIYGDTTCKNRPNQMPPFTQGSCVDKVLSIL